jgi:anti-anti-sigma factor
MSCEVIAMLAGVYREVHRQNGRIGLCGLQPLFRKMIQICHLDGMLEIYADEAEAIERIREPKAR